MGCLVNLDNPRALALHYSGIGVHNAALQDGAAVIGIGAWLGTIVI